MVVGILEELSCQDARLRLQHLCLSRLRFVLLRFLGSTAMSGIQRGKRRRMAVGEVAEESGEEHVCILCCCRALSRRCVGRPSRPATRSLTDPRLCTDAFGAGLRGGQLDRRQLGLPLPILTLPLPPPFCQKVQMEIIPGKRSLGSIACGCAGSCEGTCGDATTCCGFGRPHRGQAILCNSN